jgi:short-subunit dehydrogenase
MNAAVRPLAVVTGASSGIGLELAKECARNGYDLVIAADTPFIGVMDELRALGANVETVEVDLATEQGVDTLYESLQGRTVDALLANAGHGLGKGFLDQDFADVRHVIDTNITGTIYLIHLIGNDMRSRNGGRILITGSIARFMPGTFQAEPGSAKQ